MTPEARVRVHVNQFYSAHPLTRSPAHPLTRSPAHSLTRSPAHPLARSPARPLTRSPARPLTRSPAHSPPCLAHKSQVDKKPDMGVTCTKFLDGSHLTEIFLMESPAQNFSYLLISTIMSKTAIDDNYEHVIPKTVEKLTRRYCRQHVTEKIQYVWGINVKEIEDNAFIHARSHLEMVVFPKCTIVGNFVFRNCSMLRIADFPKLVHAGDEAFRGCSKLSHNSIPRTLQTLYVHTYSDCSTELTNTLETMVGWGWLTIKNGKFLDLSKSSRHIEEEKSIQLGPLDILQRAVKFPGQDENRKNKEKRDKNRILSRKKAA